MIYLDHFASSPMSDAVKLAMRDALGAAGVDGNASSVHTTGRAARAVIDRARDDVAAVTRASARELVFTSGGTEAVQLAVLGAGEGGAVRAVLMDPGAHPSVRAACEQLARARSIALETAAVVSGALDVDALDARLSVLPAPALVVLASVQHETGVVAPLRAVCDRARARGALVVLDAVQALGRRPLDLGASGAVAAALSAHKIGGPSGIGAAWFAPDARVASVLRGGAQERGLRAGSENVLGIVGFAAAAREVPTRWLAARARIGALRDRIERGLRAIDGVVINGAESERVEHACHASVRGVAGEELVAALDLAGYCVASGPACSSGRPGPSESMLALYPDEPWRARASLRITLGPSNGDEVDRFVEELPAVIRRVRAG